MCVIVFRDTLEAPYKLVWLGLEINRGKFQAQAHFRQEARRGAAQRERSPATREPRKQPKRLWNVSSDAIHIKTSTDLNNLWEKIYVLWNVSLSKYFENKTLRHLQ